jgi:rRNA maturation endonuclease Nob1
MTTTKPPVYVDKKTESYPEWLAEMKYDSNKSFRDNYLENAMQPFMRPNTIYTLRQQQQLSQLEAAKKLTTVKNKKKKNWRDYVRFIL